MAINAHLLVDSIISDPSLLILGVDCGTGKFSMGQ
jgi:hypothetical protein